MHVIKGKYIVIGIIVSCTELIEDAESIRGKCTWDKSEENKYFLMCLLEVKVF